MHPALPGAVMLSALQLGPFPMGNWLTALSRACSMQGQTPNCYFLIYLNYPGSPLLINYHLVRTQEGNLPGGQWEVIDVEILSGSSGCEPCCWKQYLFSGYIRRGHLALYKAVSEFGFPYVPSRGEGW